jgi:hypothetical protein
MTEETTAPPETTANGTTAPPTDKAPAWVDDRIKKLSAQRGEALDRIASLEKELEALRPVADSGAAWKTKAEELEAELGFATKQFKRDRALLEAGVRDGEIRELFEWQFEKLDKEGRPEFSEWLSSLTAESAPASLRAHLPSSQAPQAAPAPTPTATPTAPPAADAGARHAPPPPREVTADDIRGATAENWSQLRERLKAEYSNRRR